MIRVGSMRHVMRVEKRSTTRDAAGEPLHTWTTLIERMCAIERAPGSEVWASAGKNSRVPAVFRTRYEQVIMTAVGANDVRVIVNEKLYDISSAYDPDGLKHEMIVTATEKVQEVP
jgi:SPP1 family predicted phage head-tail adaptor